MLLNISSNGTSANVGIVNKILIRINYLVFLIILSYHYVTGVCSYDMSRFFNKPLTKLI